MAPHESTDTSAAITRGVRESDPQAYGTAFEVQQRVDDGAAPGASKPKGSGMWPRVLGLGLIALAAWAAYDLMSEEKGRGKG